MTTPCKKGHVGGRRGNGNCIECERERYALSERKREQTKEAARKKRERIRSDPELLAAHRAYQIEYRKRNAERIAARQAERQRELSVEIRLKRKGLDPKEHAEVVRSHPGLCDLCGKEPDGKWKVLNIDHCHATKVFRGILCANCNRGIGYFADDPDLMRKAADYVEAARARNIA